MTTTTEIHAAIAQMQVLIGQAADVIEQNTNSLAESHTKNGIIEDTEVQAAVESDTDLVAHLRAAALPWDQRHKPAAQNECLCRDKCLHAGAMGQCKGLPSVLAEPVQQEPVGELTIGGVIDTSDGPEYEDWDIEWNNKAIEALQDRLVTRYPVTLSLYTSPQPAQPQQEPWKPTEADYKEWWDRHGLHGPTARAAFDDATSLYLTAAHGIKDTP